VRALVTGAGRRVGRATALELAGAGYDVCVHYRSSAAEADEVAAACRARGVAAWTVAGDLATTDGVSAVADAVLDRWDSLDLLVNNASVFEAVPFEQIDAAHWERMLALHARAPLLLSQRLLPRLRSASADRGDALVVHLCDIGAERPVSGYAAYSVSKAALVMLVKAMAVELAPAVRTCGVSPGQVAWPETYDEALRERILRRIPLRRVGTPEDVAVTIRFLATEGRYLNGVIVPVDGGLSQRY
jgi:pteridine reductase